MNEGDPPITICGWTRLLVLTKTRAPQFWAASSAATSPSAFSRNTTCLLISAADHIDQAHPPLTRCPAADDTVLLFGAILFAPNITPTTQGMWQPRSFALGTVTHKSVAFDHLRPLVTTSRTQVLDAVLRTESVTFKTTLHHGPQKRPSPAACLERIQGSGGSGSGTPVLRQLQGAQTPLEGS